MKGEGAIKQKLKQARFRSIKREVRRLTSKKPSNCKHSGLVRGHAGEPLFHVCLLDADKPEEWEGTICDASVPNTCPFFTPRQTKEEIEAQVNADLESGDMNLIASKYPHVATLLWVLAGVEEGDEDV